MAQSRRVSIASLASIFERILNDNLIDEFRKVRFKANAHEAHEHFFIVTAYNPDGINVSDDQNTEADKELLDVMTALELDAFRVTGGNHDFSHSEPGWGIVCSNEQANELSSKFRQLAYFEVIEDQLLLHMTNEPAVEALGNWSSRILDDHS